MRRVKTASGATAVQIAHKRDRRILSMDHVGSARDEVELALLLQVAQERMPPARSSPRWVARHMATGRSRRDGLAAAPTRLLLQPIVARA